MRIIHSLLFFILSLNLFAQQQIDVSGWGDFASTIPLNLNAYTHNDKKESNFIETTFKFTRDNQFNKFRIELSFFCKSKIPFTDRISMLIKFGNNEVDSFYPNELTNYKGVLSENRDLFKNKFGKNLTNVELAKIKNFGIKKIRIGYVDFYTKNEQYYDWVFSEDQTKKTKELITLLENFDFEEYNKRQKQKESNAKKNLYNNF